MLRANDTGSWTKPSPAQYPHQWNWDSGFCSLGWATFDPGRARLELESLLGARWRSGMVPHLHYDPAHLADYFPGPDRWPGAERQVAVPGTLTSGITNPPVAALAACRLAAAGGEEGAAFGGRVCDALCAWVGYLLEDRRSPVGPLVTVVHPWETGWDNSPRWDQLPAAGLKPKRAYQRLDTRAVAGAQRPGARDYDGYIALAEIISEGGFDLAAYRGRTPFLVHDVVFDALTHRAAVELNGLCVSLGRPPAFAAERLREFAQAFEDFHWNPGAATYHDYDLVTGRRLETPSAAAVAAIGGDLVPAERALALLDRYRERCRGLVPLPTVPPDSPAFDPALYWRGPVWLSVNWLVIDGLRRLGLAEASRRLARESIAAFGRSGFAEYLDPVSGEPRGIGGFSWTAALLLDLLATTDWGGRPARPAA